MATVMTLFGRFACAIIFAPLIIIVIIYALLSANGGFGFDGALVGSLMFGGMIGYPNCILFALASIVVLRRRGWNGMTAYALAGLIVCVPSAILVPGWGPFLLMAMGILRPIEKYFSADVWFWMAALLPASLVGPVAGLVFWAILRPDRFPRAPKAFAPSN